MGRLRRQGLWTGSGRWDLDMTEVIEVDAQPLIDGPADAGSLLILAHGAGQGPESPFMAHITHALVTAGDLRVIRPSFPYMAKTAADGRKRPPDREPKLLESLRLVVESHRAGPQRLVIGGKSMGGRIGAMLADEVGAAGLVCLGYPFHTPGNPEHTRLEALAALRAPALICQGERDPFGNRDDVAGYRLSPTVRLAWITDGEHSFKPRKASGRTWEDNLNMASELVLAFLHGLD